MKQSLMAGIVPLFALLVFSAGCSKTTDLRNKTAITVSCERNSTNPGEAQTGSEVAIREEASGQELIQFTLVPSAITFEDLQPGTYRIWGMNSSSIDTLHVTVAQNERPVVVLKYP